MRVLCHGIPFCCNNTPLVRYRGPHEIRSLGFSPDVWYRYDPANETIRDIVNRISGEWKPDLILCWVPGIHPPPLGIEASPIPTVALVSDWNIFYPVLAVNLARYDLVLCDKPGVAALKSELVSPQHLFPLYSQITTIHNPYPVEKDIDILFAGNLSRAAHPERTRYLHRLAQLSDRYRVVITAGVYRQEYARLLSRARIVFNHSIRGELNLRVFETMACGSLAFLEEDNQEVRDWFEDRRDIVLYNEVNFEEHIEYFLEHQKEAERIAAQGHARAPEFAGENRFTELIDWAARQPSSGRRFAALPAQEQDYQTVLMYSASRWSEHRPLAERCLFRPARTFPDDPRVWTAVGQYVLGRTDEGESDSDRKERSIKAFVQAHRLDPGSAPYALNAASIHRHWGEEEGEAHYLQAVLNADSLAGAKLVVGSHENPFWVRWQRAVAEKKASLAMVKAEARIRLATMLAQHGQLDLAEDHLAKAASLDPQNVGGPTLWAEVRWVAGKNVEAVDILVRHLPDMPFDIDVRHRLAQMLENVGYLEEAKAVIRQTRLLVNVLCPEASADIDEPA